jgi:hypothetical protein
LELTAQVPTFPAKLNSDPSIPSLHCCGNSSVTEAIGCNHTPGIIPVKREFHLLSFLNEFFSLTIIILGDIQGCTRRFFAIRLADKMRETIATTMIQSALRSSIVRNKYLDFISAATCLQTMHRRSASF